MGIPFEEIWLNWSSAKITLYQCYYQSAPWGEDRADIRNALSMAQTANMHRDPKTHPNPFPYTDFMPFMERREPSATVTTTDGLRAAFKRLQRRNRKK